MKRGGLFVLPNSHPKTITVKSASRRPLTPTTRKKLQELTQQFDQSLVVEFNRSNTVTIKASDNTLLTNQTVQQIFNVLRSLRQFVIATIA